jgi:hypothetical protein
LPDGSCGKESGSKLKTQTFTIPAAVEGGGDRFLPGS